MEKKYTFTTPRSWYNNCMLIKRDLKRLLVFCLAFVFDQYQKISIKNYYRALYFPGGYPKRESLHKLVYRLTKIKQIEKEVKNGEVFLTLTSKGGSFFNEKISLQTLAKKEWDRKWRLVIFDIKEIERKLRDNLRELLKKWGFAMWQESVYISPHPILKEIDEFLKVNKLFPKVVTMEAEIVGIKNHDRFAWVVFKLGNLEKKYLEIKNKILALKKTEIKKTSLKEILLELEETVVNDPFLPKGLIKENWPRGEVVDLLKELLSS